MYCKAAAGELKVGDRVTSPGVNRGNPGDVVKIMPNGMIAVMWEGTSRAQVHYPKELTKA